MKKLLAIILVLIMCISLIACGATEEPVATEPAKADTPATEKAEEKEGEQTPVTLSVWHYNDAGAEEIMNDWAAAVNAKYPWITMEVEILPYDSGPEKFTVACATNTTPDLYYDGYSRIAPAVNAGLTIDVSALRSAHADVFYGDQKAGYVGDKLGYLELGSSAAYGLFVNMDLAEKLGVADMLPEDKMTWSYDEYLELCRTAKAADSSIVPQALFAGSQSSDAWYYSWFLGNGSKILNADGSATAFNTAEYKDATLEVLDVFKTLIDEGLVNNGCATMTDQDCEQLWCAGNLLFLPNSLNMATYYQDLQDQGVSAEFNFDVVALPTKAGAAPATSSSWGSNGFCAFGNNGNEEAINLALEVWLENPEFQSRHVVSLGASSMMNNAVIEYSSESLAEIMAFVDEYTAGYAVSDFGILEPWWSDFRGTFYPQMQDFYVGNIDAQTVLNNWQAAADQIIANAG